MRLTPQQALDRLTGGRRRARGEDPLKLISTFGDADDDLYIFGNSQGGVLTTAIDTLPSIIGTWEGEGDTLPPALQDMLQEYAAEVEWWERCGEELSDDSKARARAQAAPRQSVPTLMDTKWSQSSPYNDTIVFDGNKCPTGCNATASAQVIYYWGKKGYHRGCKATKAYKTATNNWEVEALPALTIFDYENLVKTPKTNKQKKAVQQLMEYLGRTFQSDYRPNGTTAYPKQVADYLKDNFRMGSMIAYIKAAKLGAKSFENYIYNELLQSRPVLVAGWTTSGSGHIFVVDGYDAENDMYHVNWGWGSYNGWFKLSALNPTSQYAFNSNKVAIIGIHPEYKLGDVNGDGEINVADVMQAANDVTSGKYDERSDINSDGEVTVTDVTAIVDHILGRKKL